MFGLEKDKLLGRMEMLAKRAAKKIKNKVAPGKPHYTASFLRWSRRNKKKNSHTKLQIYIQQKI